MSYKMKRNKSTFPFKSPVKQLPEGAIPQGPVVGQPGQDWLEEKNRRTGGATPQYTGAFQNPTSRSGAGGAIAGPHLLGRRRKDQEPTLTPEEYEAQGLNKWGGTDLSI